MRENLNQKETTVHYLLINFLSAPLKSLQSAEQIYGWISRHLPAGSYQPSIQRPPNYTRIITITTAVLGLITFFSVAAPYLLPVVQNRNLWAAISLLIILLFTSGHMFNHIRKVPYVTGDANGNIIYFAGGFSNQFGLETQIVAGMCTYLPTSHLFSISSEAPYEKTHRLISTRANHPSHKQTASFPSPPLR